MLAKVSVCLLIALCAGCGNPSKAPTVTTQKAITSSEAEAILRSVHIIPMLGFACGDDRYEVPDEGWVTGEFLDLLRKFQFSLKQTHYASESNDCDDFAKMAAAFAKLVHNNTPHLKATSISIGEFYYTQSAGSNHAINFAIVRTSKGDLKLMFFEPQSWEPIKLTEAEIQSCLNWIL